MLGTLIGLFVRVYVWFLRVRVIAHPSLPSDRSWVYAFWHGTQLALLAKPRRRPTAVLVSLSRDGALQSNVMKHHGMIVVRGSSSRRASSGLRGIVRALREGRDAAFAVDGPRGPIHRSKPGAIHAARAANAVIVPVGVHASLAFELRAWDRFLVPLPFARVTIVLGAPLEPNITTRELDDAIERALPLEDRDGVDLHVRALR